MQGKVPEFGVLPWLELALLPGGPAPGGLGLHICQEPLRQTCKHEARATACCPKTAGESSDTGIDCKAFMDGERVCAMPAETRLELRRLPSSGVSALAPLKASAPEHFSRRHEGPEIPVWQLETHSWASSRQRTCPVESVEHDLAGICVSTEGHAFLLGPC